MRRASHRLGVASSSQRRSLWWLLRSRSVAESKPSALEVKAEGVLKELSNLALGQDKLVEAVVQSLASASAMEADARRMETRVALLIDAENTSPSSLPGIMRETGKFGVATARKIFANWTSPQNINWRQRIIENGLTPIQQFNNSVGKNSSDSALIIEAMDLLHSGKYSTFVLVSNDGDFTRLATRIREDGKFVVGVGRPRVAAVAFVQACSAFVYIDQVTNGAGAVALDNTRVQQNNLITSSSPPPAPPQPLAERPPQRAPSSSSSSSASSSSSSSHKKLLAGPRRQKALSTLAKVVDTVKDDSGWAALGTVGTALREKDPHFDPKTLLEGGTTLSKLLKALPDYEYRIDGSTAQVRSRTTRSSASGSSASSSNTSGGASTPAVGGTANNNTTTTTEKKNNSAAP